MGQRSQRDLFIITRSIRWDLGQVRRHLKDEVKRKRLIFEKFLAIESAKNPTHWFIDFWLNSSARLPCVVSWHFFWLSSSSRFLNEKITHLEQHFLKQKLLYRWTSSRARERLEFTRRFVLPSAWATLNIDLKTSPSSIFLPLLRLLPRRFNFLSRDVLFLMSSPTSSKKLSFDEVDNETYFLSFLFFSLEFTKTLMSFELDYSFSLLSCLSSFRCSHTWCLQRLNTNWQ